VTDGCVKGAQNEGRIKAIEDRVDKNDVDHVNFAGAIKEIRDHLLARPAWPVVFMMMFMSSLCVGLIVKMVTG
jgi:uncharacterized membrane protein YjjP (DUF1212 family)